MRGSRFRRQFAVLCSAALGLALGHGLLAPVSLAQADPIARHFAAPARAAGEPVRAEDEPQVADYYEAGNQVLSQQAVHNLRFRTQMTALMTTASELEKKGDRKGADETRAEVRRNLPGLCKAGEATQDCFKRYEDTQPQFIAQIRGGIGAHKKVMADLQGNPAPVVVPERSAAEASAGSPARAARGPLVLSVEDLQQLYRMSARGRKTGEAYQEWLRQLPGWLADVGLKAPVKEDFVRFERIPRFPGTSNPETITRVVTQPDGSPAYDERLWESARQHYLAKVKDYLRDGAELAKSPEAAQAVPTTFAQAAREQNVALRAFREVRFSITTQINDDLGSGAPKEPGQRAIAAAAPGQPGAPVDRAAQVSGATGEDLSKKSDAELDAAQAKPIPTELRTYSATISEQELDRRLNRYLGL